VEHRNDTKASYIKILNSLLSIGTMLLLLQVYSNLFTNFVLSEDSLLLLSEYECDFVLKPLHTEQKDEFRI
jgi:hypothetical protein